MPRLPVLLMTLTTTLVQAQDGLCPQWSGPEAVGELDIGALPEASGIAVSANGSSLYLINDGTRPVLHVTAIEGGPTRRVRITGFSPLDLEDLALGRCGRGICLYLADIGDNALRRTTVQIAIVEDQAEFGSEVAARRVVVARYPDGPHDAEAIAIDPAGDLWLVTKSPLGRQMPARVFRLSAQQLAASGEQILEDTGEIPVASLAAGGSSRRRLVTSMDIAPDGRRFVLLTYDTAIEFAVELARGLPGPGSWEQGRTHRAIAIAPLIQAESIAYTDDGHGLIYTTESIRGSAAPLIRQTCR